MCYIRVFHSAGFITETYWIFIQNISKRMLKHHTVQQQKVKPEKRWNKHKEGKQKLVNQMRRRKQQQQQCIKKGFNNGKIVEIEQMRIAAEFQYVKTTTNK